MAISKEGRLVSLDGMRAVSILLVIAWHATDSSYAEPWLHHFSPYFDGVLGVRIFFVISGYIITWLLISEQKKTGGISLGNFYIRRFLRLFPVEIVYLATIFLLTKITSLHIPNCAFLTALTYTKNYACFSATDSHFWSLSVEEQFYLFWPLAFMLLSRRWAVCFAVLLIFIAPFSRAIQYHSGNHNWWWLTSNADALMIGCLAAVFFDAQWLHRLVFYRPTVGRLCAFVLIAIPAVMRNYMVLAAFTVLLGPILQEICVAYLIASYILVRQGLSFRLLNSKLLIFIGLASYSLYVWQEIFFYTKSTDYGFAHLSLLHFPFNIVACFVAGILSYYIIERSMVSVRRVFVRERYGSAQGRITVSGDFATRDRSAASAHSLQRSMPPPVD